MMKKNFKNKSIPHHGVMEDLISPTKIQLQIPTLLITVLIKTHSKTIIMRII